MNLNSINQSSNSSPIISNNSSNLSGTLIYDAYSAHLQDIMTLLNKIYPLPLCLSGTVGNLFIFIIYLRAPALHKVSTSFYILLQTFTDTLLIYLGVLRYFILGVSNINIKDSSMFMCKALNYSIFVINFMAAWLLVVSSIDRLVFVFNYSRLQFILKRRVQIIISVILPFIGLLIYFWHPISYGFIYDPKTQKASCNELDLTYKRILYLLELIFTVLLPFALLTLTSLYLTLTIKKSKRKLESLNKSSNLKLKDDSSHNFHPKMASSSFSSRDSQKNYHRSTFPFTLTLLTLNLFFLLFLMPHTLIIIYKSYMNINTTQVNFYYTIATIIRYSFFSLSFLAHYFSNRIFREHFLNLTWLGNVRQSKV